MSKGTHDLVHGCLRQLEVEELFHGVALKPGKPTYFGVQRRGDVAVYVFGLPGNPASCYTVFDLLVRPLLARLGGGAELPPRRVEARVTGAAFRPNWRLQAIPASMALAAGEVVAVLETARPSGDPFGLTAADGYVLVPAEADPAATTTAASSRTEPACLVHEPPLEGWNGRQERRAPGAAVRWSGCLAAALLLAAATPPGWFPGAGLLVVVGLGVFYAVATTARRPQVAAYCIGLVHVMVFSWSLRDVLLLGYLAVGLLGGCYYSLAVAWMRGVVSVAGRAAGLRAGVCQLAAAAGDHAGDRLSARPGGALSVSLAKVAGCRGVGVASRSPTPCSLAWVRRSSMLSSLAWR